MPKTRKGRRKSMAVRHPSGQIKRTRSERKEETMSPAITARQRQFGVTAAQANDPALGSAIGRLRRAGEITEAQYEAGVEYAKLKERYSRAILAGGLGSPADLDRGGGHDNRDGTDERYVASCRSAYDGMAAARQALAEADPLAQRAVDLWVIENQEVHRVIGDLRLGLNALARLFRVSEWMREKAA
jgi:hypothetical protein